MSRNKIRIYEVGGSIRNELMGRPAKDRDFAVLAPSYKAMKAYIEKQGGRIYQERPQFVSIKARLAGLGDTDFTLARKESFYTDARHPDSVKPAKTIEEDLSRRDFTMNAIAREVGTDTLIDPFDGIGAIQRKTINSVGHPMDRFKEDRLRIFRAIRFATVLDFAMVPSVINAINNFKFPTDFNSVSSEMIQIELWKAFSSNTQVAFRWIEAFPHLLHIMALKGIRLKPTLEK